MLGGKTTRKPKKPVFGAKDKAPSRPANSHSTSILIVKAASADHHHTIEDFFHKTTSISITYKNLPRAKTGKLLPIGNWHLGVSHSEDYLAVAISDQNVGIDIEKSTHCEKLTPRILQKILAPGENPVVSSPQKLQNSNASSKLQNSKSTPRQYFHKNFLNNFVVKEAYLKLEGSGLSLGFNNYDANHLLADKSLTWQNLSTEDYVCYLVSEN